MKRRILVGCCALALVTGFWATQTFAADQAEQSAIKALIETSYVNGAFNALDPDAMRSGFHEDFSIFSPKGEAISKYPIADWARSAEQRKAKPGFDPAKNKWEHNFTSIDVTGRAATVKLELSKGGKQVYTDYLSLLKFDSGWRIVAKVYHQHS